MEDPYVHMDLQKEQQPQVSGAEFQVPFVSVYGAKARSRESVPGIGSHKLYLY
jgi:hypothetical protein